MADAQPIANATTDGVSRAAIPVATFFDYLMFSAICAFLTYWMGVSLYCVASIH